jgi:hypothetical protein
MLISELPVIFVFPCIGISFYYLRSYCQHRQHTVLWHTKRQSDFTIINIQTFRKLTQPNSWHMFYLLKNKLHWNQETENTVILSVGNVHRVQRCVHSLFSSCLMQRNCFWPARFLCPGNGSPYEIFSICLAQENREMFPETNSGKLSKNEMPRIFRQRTLVALVKKTSLHFNCWKTTDELARAGYNMTWSALALVYSQQYCVFINPVELYWIATIN